MAHAVFGNTKNGAIIKADELDLEISAGTIKFVDYGKGVKTGTEAYVLCITSDGTLVETVPSSLPSSGGSNGGITLQVTFVEDGDSSNKYLRHQFDNNNSSDSWGWIVPEDGNLIKIYAQGRGTSGGKDLVVYSNAVEISRTDTSGVNNIVVSPTLALSAGDEVSVQMDNVGSGGAWDDVVVYLMFSIS